MRKKMPLLVLMFCMLLTACSVNQDTLPKKSVNKIVLPKPDHILIVIEENHSQQEIEGNPSAPYMNFLMKHGANFTNFHATTHPSQPNYLALFSGSTQGVTSDHVPDHLFSANNLGNELLKNKYTFTGYSESLPYVGFNGETDSTQQYARKHNPWVNFKNISKVANKPLSDFPKDFKQLPTVSFVIPNLQNDMHNGSIKQADKWLKLHLASYVKWASTHNSLLIVTWDEAERLSFNKIPTFFVGPMVKKGTYDEDLNHYNLLRTMEDIYGLKHVGASTSVLPITNTWK